MPLFAIGTLSAGVLAYEVLLMRLLAIVQWSHFAYMAISIALLGYGASGTFIALWREALTRNARTAFALNAALFGLFALVGFAAAQRLPFNPLAVIWEPDQLAWLPLLYLVFALPFFCGANCVGLALAAFPDRIGRVYRADLAGAGLGALGVVAVLFLASPTRALAVIAGLGPLAGAVAVGRPRPAVILVALAAALAGVPSSWNELRLSEYKGLSQALLAPGAAVVAERSSALGLISAVKSPAIPFRHVPGLSLDSPVEPPEQLGLFTDGDSLSVVTAFDGRPEPLAYLDYTPAALPYHLLTRPEVLVLGAGGGADVLQALVHDAAQIDAVELDPNVARLVREDFAGFAGRLYDLPRVRLHLGEGREFVAGTDARYDLIQIPLLDSFAAAAAGTRSLSESYLYTVEAFQQYLSRLKPGGYLAITRWLKLPPRDSLKLLATALAAMERGAVAEPARRLALLRSWNTITLLVKNGTLAERDIATIREFAQRRSFDIAYLPGLRAAEANRFNLLDEDTFHDGAMALIGPGRQAFLDAYKFDLRPATDDRPYFFDFFKWRALPELLERRALGGAALLDWGYPVLVATLVQAIVLGLALILLPLWLAGRRARDLPGRWRVAGYFFLIGLAFLFVEIASIQRFMLFLGHPIYAVSVVLFGFLVFAGVGSGAASSLARRLEGRRLTALRLAIFAVAALAALHLILLPPLFRSLMALPDAAKIALSIACIAPLALFMGMPFPLALARVAARSPALVPWAWGVNGCASVISAVLAALIAVNLGFAAVIAMAILLYLAAATKAMTRWSTDRSPACWPRR